MVNDAIGARRYDRQGGGEEFPLRLADARQIAVTRFDTGFKTGVKINLSKWLRDRGGPTPTCPLTLTLCLEGRDEDVVFEAAAVSTKHCCASSTGPAARFSRC